MKKLFFLLTVLVLIFIVGCNKNSDLQSKFNENEKIVNNNILLERNDVELDIKAIHDSYCQLICDSISNWRIGRELDSTKILRVWETIQIELSKTLDIPIDSVTSLFYKMNINSSNFTNVYEEKYILLSTNQKRFIDDLEAVFMENHDESDEVLIQLFENKEQEWNNILDPISVHNTIEIAKSSFIYWKNNFDSCIIDDDELLQRAPRWRAMAKLALGDATGALWGLWGGAAGALVGAVGGTLGATIEGAVFGFD